MAEDKIKQLGEVRLDEGLFSLFKDYDKETINRIKAKTIVEGNCYRFMGKKAGNGYGCIWYKRRTVRIGRLICHLFHGMDLKNHDLVACHSDECKFHDCWNPDHLRADTQMNNVNDQIRTGNFSYGTANMKFNRNK